MSFTYEEKVDLSNQLLDIVYRIYDVHIEHHGDEYIRGYIFTYESDTETVKVIIKPYIGSTSQSYILVSVVKSELNNSHQTILMFTSIHKTRRHPRDRPFTTMLDRYILWKTIHEFVNSRMTFSSIEMFPGTHFRRPQDIVAIMEAVSDEYNRNALHRV